MIALNVIKQSSIMEIVSLYEAIGIFPNRERDRAANNFAYLYTHTCLYSIFTFILSILSLHQQIM